MAALFRHKKIIAAHPRQDTVVVDNLHWKVVKAWQVILEAHRQGLSPDQNEDVKRLNEAVYDAEDLLAICGRPSHDSYEISKIHTEKLRVLCSDIWGALTFNSGTLKGEVTCSDVCEDEIIGRDADKNTVVEMLLSASDFDSPNRVIGIGGMRLFMRFAFPTTLHQQPVADDDLVRIAKQVTLKCSNLPLALKVIGKLLYCQPKSKWLEFQTTDFKDITEITSHMIPTLRHHYRLRDNRHTYHDAHFIWYVHFCLIFPRDYVIEKEVLFNMWFAAGYLDTEYRYQGFSRLINSSIFQGFEQNEWGDIISFKMNDWMRIVAQLDAEHSVLMLTDTNTQYLNFKIRHLSISKLASNIDLFGQHYPASKTLVTIFNLREYAPCSFKHINAILSQCTRLRLLDLSGVSIETLPDTFDKVPVLRYLDLSNNECLEKLPPSVTKLRCLVVLRLRGCKNLKELPEDTSNLVTLMTLDIAGCNKLTRMPAGMDKLTRLHMLTMFVVGDDDSKQGNWGKLVELKALERLECDLLIKVGRFSLSNMFNATEGTYILRQLRLLALEIICEDGSSDQGDAHETLLESLHPHYDLRRILIQGFQGTKLPSWASLMTDSVSHIVSITLSHFCGLQHLTTLSQLGHLKCLYLVKLWNVESIEGDAPSELTSGNTKSMMFFPCLEKLVLEWMPKLKVWWRDLTLMEKEASRGCMVDGSGSIIEQLMLPTFPRLHDLKVRHCPRMTYFPSCPHVKQLELSGINEAFCFLRSSLSNPVAPESSNSGDVNFILEKLILSYDTRVLDSLFGKSVVLSSSTIDIKYIFGEENLQVAREGFQRCSSSLKHLSINGFYNLKSLSGGGIEHLTNLQSLSIKDCFVLNLEEFEMEGEEEEEGMPWKSLHSLSTLYLDDLPKLVNLPKGFQHLTALQSLHIKSCRNLEALGECICSLTSLQSLHIEDCNNLKTLPECLASLISLQSIHVDDCKNLKALPECINSLISRQILHIKNCPRLESAAPLINGSSVKND